MAFMVGDNAGFLEFLGSFKDIILQISESILHAVYSACRVEINT